MKAINTNEVINVVFVCVYNSRIVFAELILETLWLKQHAATLLTSYVIVHRYYRTFYYIKTQLRVDI